mmetsp:Transcript_1318/g.1160  ORF Transcript_1318/g.1160 Transcript_1318/m.1160 type:complete len:352 (-) Transcript_1318:58-1113(-)
MAVERWLLQTALFSGVALCAWAGSKDLVAHIQCAVCKQAVREAHVLAKEKDLNNADSDEEVVTDALEDLCSAKKEQGKWTTRMDIMRKPGGTQLILDRRDQEGACNKECKAVQKACSGALKGREESLVSLIREGAGVGRLQREVCKKPCSKTLPELQHWKDEPFVPVVPPPTPALPKAEVGAKLLPEIIMGALAELGGSPLLTQLKECYSGAKATDQTAHFIVEVQGSIDDMLAKEFDKMRSGLSRLGRAMAELAGTFTSMCSVVQASVAEHMEKLGKKLAEHCEGDPSAVEYKPLEVLTVNGHDLHKQVNAFIGAWKKDNSDGMALGEAVGKLLKALESDIEAETPKTEL